jgi:enoyl-CoA hydratase
VDSVALDRGDGIATLTIANEAQRNALSDPVLAELANKLADLDRDAAARAIVLAGSAKVFASGADIRALVQRRPLEAYSGDRARRWESIRGVRTPVVAAVSGLCLGGGCELAMIADIVVASEASKFGLPETMLGLIPGAGGTQMLPRAVGKALAMDMILTGRLLDAAEAERAGLVSRVTGPDDWLKVAQEVALTIAGRPAVAQRLAKEAVQQAAETSLSSGIVGERRAFTMAFGSDDAIEGLTAFIEKRSPGWKHS